MKKNVMLCDTMKLREILKASGIRPIAKPHVTEEGDFCFLSKKPCTRFVEMIMPPCQIAAILNMPLWEVVQVDNGGFDEYALLFFEEG